MHSIEYCYEPSSFIDNKSFPKNSQIEVHPYPLRNINDFFTPPVLNGFLARFPFYSFPVWWNSLDQLLFSQYAIETLLDTQLNRKFLLFSTLLFSYLYSSLPFFLIVSSLFSLCCRHLTGFEMNNPLLWFFSDLFTFLACKPNWNVLRLYSLNRHLIFWYFVLIN